MTASLTSKLLIRLVSLCAWVQAQPLRSNLQILCLKQANLSHVWELWCMAATFTPTLEDSCSFRSLATSQFWFLSSSAFCTSQSRLWTQCNFFGSILLWIPSQLWHSQPLLPWHQSFLSLSFLLTLTMYYQRLFGGKFMASLCGTPSSYALCCSSVKALMTWSTRMRLRQLTAIMEF